MSDSNIYIDLDKVRGLYQDFQSFEENAKDEIDCINGHIDENMEKFDSIRHSIQDILEKAEEKRRKAEDALDRCERSQRYDEERGCRVPSCRSEQSHYDEACREVQKWRDKLGQCQALIQKANSAISNYREKERLMNTVLNEYTPDAEQKLLTASERAETYMNMHSSVPDN